jgi:hypothetical protein
MTIRCIPVGVVAFCLVCGVAYKPVKSAVSADDREFERFSALPIYRHPNDQSGSILNITTAPPLNAPCTCERCSQTNLIYLA